MFAHSAILFTRANRKLLILADVLTSSVRNTKKVSKFLYSFCVNDCLKSKARTDRKYMKRYLFTDTFFIVLNKVAVIFLALALWSSNEVRADNCSLSGAQLQKAQKVKIEKVIDGDTLRLSNGKLVRFIGVNTPEIDHQYGNSQPFADRARQYLQAKVSRFKGNLVLAMGSEKRDRHGRLLAHIFTPRGQNIQADILLNGFGVWIVVPPNLRFLDCYQQNEKKARSEKRGVWGEQFRFARNTTTLTEKDRGFQWIQGRISRIGKGKKNWWLNFVDKRSVGKFSKVSLRVRKDDLQYFNEHSLEKLINKVIRVKGWLSLNKNQLVMNLRHPASIEVVE